MLPDASVAVQVTVVVPSANVLPLTGEHTTLGNASHRSTAVGALNNYDIPTVQGVIVFATIAIIIFNLVVDLLYAVVDPRIRLA